MTDGPSVIVRGARLLGGEPTDLLLRDGLVAEVGAGAGNRLGEAGAMVLDADGLVALPGLVDLHTHLREPGREDAETVATGTRAAASVPVSTVSASSRPGSRRCVCRSTRPGSSTQPRAS